MAKKSAPAKTIVKKGLDAVKMKQMKMGKGKKC